MISTVPDAAVYFRLTMPHVLRPAPICRSLSIRESGQLVERFKDFTTEHTESTEFLKGFLSVNSVPSEVKKFRIHHSAFFIPK